MRVLRVQLAIGLFALSAAPQRTDGRADAVLVAPRSTNPEGIVPCQAITSIKQLEKGKVTRNVPLEHASGCVLYNIAYGTYQIVGSTTRPISGFSGTCRIDVERPVCAIPVRIGEFIDFGPVEVIFHPPTSPAGASWWLEVHSPFVDWSHLMAFAEHGAVRFFHPDDERNLVMSLIADGVPVGSVPVKVQKGRSQWTLTLTAGGLRAQSSAK